MTAAALGVVGHALPSALAAASGGDPVGVTFSPLVATGGTTSEVTDAEDGRLHRVHAFTSDGTFTVSALGTSDVVEVLVVGGGGGGGIANGGGGGGGAGGVVLATQQVTLGTHAIVVGAGGAGTSVTLAYDDASAPTGATAGRPGSASSVAGPDGTVLVSALGGGGGGGESGTDAAATSGGSGGGGGGRNLKTAGAGAAGQGHDGADGVPNAGGGGGGAGGPGLAPRPTADGAGGPGLDLSGRFGTAFGDGGWFGGGGGGGDEVAGTSGYLAPATGARGGGGLGGKYVANNSSTFRAPTPGMAGTGGGGGGSGDSRTSLASTSEALFQGKPGGSGVVLIRYPISG